MAYIRAPKVGALGDAGAVAEEHFLAHSSLRAGNEENGDLGEAQEALL